MRARTAPSQRVFRSAKGAVAHAMAKPRAGDVEGTEDDGGGVQRLMRSEHHAEWQRQQVQQRIDQMRPVQHRAMA